ncbi:hypothetical protein J6590_072486 [Homalodisca vitripennis]|nr:hypothetical protein J6590_072486 [Homalodisca vitripennis]
MEETLYSVSHVVLTDKKCSCRGGKSKCALYSSNKNGRRHVQGGLYFSSEQDILKVVQDMRGGSAPEVDDLPVWSIK